MTPLSLQQIAYALGGQVTGGQVVAPGPGHSRKDRSLAVRPSTRAGRGLIVHSFAGDPWQTCRDHVAERLGLPTRDTDRVEWHRVPRDPVSEQFRIASAQKLWHAAHDPRGTLVTRYLASRGLELPGHAAVETIRFHPRSPWKDDALGLTIQVPVMLAAMRSLITRQVTAVHRTRLSEDGRKLDRRMLGVAAGTAIMLDPFDGVELAIGEGVESALSGAAFGIRPAWALASAGAVAAFPVLQGVDRLTVLGERDDASESAVTACYSRWHAAGRHVTVALPKIGKDFNDAWRARA